MRPMAAITVTELRRFVRDRSNIFFVFIFPLLLVIVIGLQFGGDGGGGRLAVSGSAGELRSELTAELADAGVTVDPVDVQTMRQQVARGRVDAGLHISAAAQTAFTAGKDAQVELVWGNQNSSQLTAQQVTTAARTVSLSRSQLTALTDQGVPESAAQDALADTTPAQVSLAITDASGIAQEFSGVGQFDVGAASQLLLFVFLISLAGSTTLIQSRKYGIQSRIVSTPVSGGQALAGQALGRWVIAIFQGVYIMAATLLLFDVSWGNVALSLLVLAVFSAVAAGGAMLIGSLVDNDGAATGIGVGMGLVLAALGGCMLPLELFPDTLRTVAHVSPHAWAYEALADIQRHGASLLDILPNLLVLAGMAVVLLGLGSWALRRSIARAL